MKLLKIIGISLLFVLAIYPQKKYGSDLQLAVANPVGKYAKYFNTGIGATWGFYYDMESNVRIGLSIGYIRIGANDEEIEQYYATKNPGGTLDMKGTLSALPINVTFRLVSPGKTQRFYGVIEGGLYTYWVDATGTYGNSTGSVPLEQSEFKSEPSLSFGVGTLFTLEETLSLDFNIKYGFIDDGDYIVIDYETGETLTTSQLIMISAGLNWNFDFTE